MITKLELLAHPGLFDFEHLRIARGSSADAAVIFTQMLPPGIRVLQDVARCSCSLDAELIGSIRLGSLFLTLPTRGLTGQHVIPSERVSERRPALSSALALIFAKPTLMSLAQCGIRA
jgi:hypothetical protein